MPVQLRPPVLSDNQPLASLIRRVFREFRIDMPGTVYTDPTTDHLYELFQTPGSAYWVAEEDGVLLGGCGIYPTPDLPDGCVELVKFYVSETARGKGIGKLLMNQSIASAREMGYRSIYLESFPELHTAIYMYQREGFKRIDHPLGNSGHYACNVWMLKDL